MSDKNLRPVESTGALGGISVSDLSKDFETIQIIAAKGERAEFDDGESYPVVAWALQARRIRDGKQWTLCTRVVGLILSESYATLVEVDNGTLDGTFARYTYAN